MQANFIRMKRRMIFLKNALKSVLIISLLFSSQAFANTKEENSGGGDLKTEIKEYIAHHLQDSYDFSLFSYTNEKGEHVYIGGALACDFMGQWT